jgi:hypothetical protein
MEGRHEIEVEGPFGQFDSIGSIYRNICVDGIFQTIKHTFDHYRSYHHPDRIFHNYFEIKVKADGNK